MSRVAEFEPAGFDPAGIERLVSPMRGERTLIALDVDGTLVDHNCVMDPEVHSVLNLIREAGHHLVIATGRSLGSTLPIVRLAGVRDGWAVSSNGAVTTRITGPDSFEVVDTLTFNPEDALRVMHSAVPQARFAVELPNGSFRATHSFDDLEFGLEAEHMTIADLIASREVVRVVVTAPDMSTEEFAKVVSSAGVHGCEYAIGWSSWMDISAPGVTKAAALETLRERLGIAREHTLAIGDGANDTDMLAWAGAGFAMGQAKESVKAYADAVTLSIDQHGAARVLRELLVD